MNNNTINRHLTIVLTSCAGFEGLRAAGRSADDGGRGSSAG